MNRAVKKKHRGPKFSERSRSVAGKQSLCRWSTFCRPPERPPRPFQPLGVCLPLLTACAACGRFCCNHVWPWSQLITTRSHGQQLPEVDKALPHPRTLRTKADTARLRKSFRNFRKQLAHSHQNGLWALFSRWVCVCPCLGLARLVGGFAALRCTQHQKAKSPTHGRARSGGGGQGQAIGISPAVTRCMVKPTAHRWPRPCPAAMQWTHVQW